MNTIDNSTQRPRAERDGLREPTESPLHGAADIANGKESALSGRVPSKAPKDLFDHPAVDTATATDAELNPSPTAHQLDTLGGKSPDTPEIDSSAGPVSGAPSPAGISNATVLDAVFIRNLDAKMAKSDLQELGWRDRDDLDLVMLDLERLAGADWRKAASLWDKYRPNDDDKPLFIDGDDKDFVPRSASSPNLHKEPATASKYDEAIPGDDGAGKDTKVTIPRALVRRYLVAENKFYFRDDPNLLAFEDTGKRLATEHNDPDVARSMVELAEAKQWNSIKVNGADEFRREVWLAASLRGLDVQGYRPNDVDRARLSELLQARPPERPNSIEQGMTREKILKSHPDSATPSRAAPAVPKPAAQDVADASSHLNKQQRIAVDTLRAILTERGDSAKAVEMAASLATERFQKQRVFVGRLLTHGAAPYEHKPDEKPNYFVTLKTINGERTIWGVDLERAIRVGAAEQGDDLAIIYRGKTSVTVPVVERDGARKQTGQQVTAVVDRNTWEVGNLDKMRQEVQGRLREAAAQSERAEPDVRVYDMGLARDRPNRTGIANQRDPEPQLGR